MELNVCEVRKTLDKYIILISPLSFTIFGRNYEYLAQLIQFRKTALHKHCVVPPAYVNLSNPHSTASCLKSSNISKKFFEVTGRADITLNNKSTFLCNARTYN